MKLTPELLAARRAEIPVVMARAESESAAPADQLTPWEVVIVDDGSTEIRAQFKRRNSTVWITLADLPYMTGKHHGGENAARIARAMNLAYPVKA